MVERGLVAAERVSLHVVEVATGAVVQWDFLDFNVWTIDN